MKLFIFFLILVSCVNLFGAPRSNYEFLHNVDSPFDAYGQLAINDEKARLDALIAAVNKDKKMQGVIIFRTDRSDSRKKKIKRFGEIARHFKRRKIDASRINLAFSESDEESTIIYLVPSDAELISYLYFDNPKNNRIINAADLKKSIGELFPK